MHIHAQIVSFVHFFDFIPCSWCKYLLQSYEFETQLINQAIKLMKNVDQLGG